jgi:hypothetical protein
MLRAVLGVQCLELVMVVDSLVMLATEGEVNRDLSCGERESAGLLDRLCAPGDDGEDVRVTISTPDVEGDSNRLVMESDRVAMSASTVVAMAWVAAVMVALLCLMMLVTMLRV